MYQITAITRQMCSDIQRAGAGPPEIMTPSSRDFSLRLLELNCAALVSRRFQHD